MTTSKNVSSSLSAPIFVIGAGRSGTTVFFDMLTQHASLGFITNYDDLLKGTPLFGVGRPLFDNHWWHRLGKRTNWTTVRDYASLLPRKTEAYRFWRRYAGEEFVRGYMWDRCSSAEQALAIRAQISWLMQWQRRQMFAAKLTGPGRIAFLRDIFPDARFIHLVRDARAQVHSTLKVGFWRAGEGDRKLWWSHDLPATYSGYLDSAVRSRDPLVLATAQWRTVVESIRIEASRVLPMQDYIELSYEAFVSEAGAAITQIWHRLGIAMREVDVARMSRIQIRRDNNQKWRSDFGLRDQETIAYWLNRPLGE